MNGVFIIGILDGVNIEIWEEVGLENFFFFGFIVEQVYVMKENGYYFYIYYDNNFDLKVVIDCIVYGYFFFGNFNLFYFIVEFFLYYDFYMLLVDY